MPAIPPAAAPRVPEPALTPRLMLSVTPLRKRGAGRTDGASAAGYHGRTAHVADSAARRRDHRPLPPRTGVEPSDPRESKESPCSETPPAAAPRCSACRRSRASVVQPPRKKKLGARPLRRGVASPLRPQPREVRRRDAAADPRAGLLPRPAASRRAARSAPAAGPSRAPARPSRRAAARRRSAARSASVTGASTPARRSARASSGTDVQRLDRLADPRRDLAPPARPGPSSSPARRLRLCGASAVPTRSPVPGQPDHRLRPRALALGVAPDLGEDVPGGGARGVQALRLGRARGQRGGVLGRARELDADRVVGLLAHDAGAHEDAGELAARARSSVDAATSPAPSVTISRACAGPPMQATRSAPKRARSSTVGAMPSGGTRPLASETTGGAARRPAAEARDHLVEPARGHAEEHVVRAREARRRPARSRSSRGSSTPGR